MSETFGVVVARFQTPELHPGHRYLLDTVQEKHRRMIVILGTARTHVPTEKNPLDFATRKAMVERYYPNATVVSVRDSRSNKVWSKTIDSTIHSIVRGMDLLCHARKGGDPGCTCLGQDAVLYGSRDSFAPYYSGRYPVVELPAYDGPTGTDLRLDAVIHPSNTLDFRRGAIYTAATRPPVLYQTVDVAIYDRKNQRVLLGRKAEDGGEKMRFVGGFVSAEDSSLEAAARREAMEETGGLELGETQYVGSFLVDDWRYRVGKDRIMTALFAVEYLFGHAKGTDDMDEAVWVEIDDLKNGKVVFTEEHQPLAEALKRFFS